MGEIRLWKMKNLHQKLMLGLSSLVSICVFCSCWALLMEGAISRLVTNGLDLLSDVLKEEVMRQVERMQMELEHKLNIMAASALLIALFRALLQEFDTLFNLSKILPAQSKSGLRVWRNIVPDIETDRVFLVSRSVDN